MSRNSVIKQDFDKEKCAEQIAINFSQWLACSDYRYSLILESFVDTFNNLQVSESYVYGKFLTRYRN